MILALDIHSRVSTVAEWLYIRGMLQKVQSANVTGHQSTTNVHASAAGDMLLESDY